MDVFKARNELLRMKRGDLFRLASEQKISRCLVGGRACSLYFHYKGLHFCVSEILGKSCLYERPEEESRKDEEILSPLPFATHLLNGLSLLGKKVTEFKVYSRDEVTRSMTLLGTIMERRMKERENNFWDLLIKARKDFADRVSDPSLIFLLGP
jgi:hypothetical protein